MSLGWCFCPLRRRCKNLNCTQHIDTTSGVALPGIPALRTLIGLSLTAAVYK